MFFFDFSFDDEMGCFCLFLFLLGILRITCSVMIKKNISCFVVNLRVKRIQILLLFMVNFNLCYAVYRFCELVERCFQVGVYVSVEFHTT